MQIQPLFPISHLSSRNCNSDRDGTPWVINAIAEEDQKPNSQLWYGEPTAKFQIGERLRRIRFLRKRRNRTSASLALAHRLELCESGDRCCSGACPECGCLFQRWFVRRLGKLIENHIERPGQELFGITIIPVELAVSPAQLNTVSLNDARRRLKRAIRKAGIRVAVVGVDFSFDEDRDGAYDPFWSLHFYLIASIADKRAISRILRKIFHKDARIPIPVKAVPFDNSAYRRSYALKIKFDRRIGFRTVRKDGRTCRNTSADRLRAVEQLELLTYLDEVGFSQRVVFLGIEPYVRDSKARIRPIPSGRRGNRAK